MEMYGAIVEPPMFIIVMGKVDCTLEGHEPTYIHTYIYTDFGLLLWSPCDITIDRKNFAVKIILRSSPTVKI